MTGLRDGWGWLAPAAGLGAAVVAIYPQLFFSKLSLLLFSGFMAGTIGFSYGFILRTKRDKVLATPTAKIGSTAMGMTELVGKAEASGPLITSPFSGKPAVYCRYVAEFSRGKEYAKLLEYESEESIVIDDGTGKALVMLSEADLRLDIYRKYHSKNLQEAAVMRSAFQRLGVTFPNLASGGVVTCEETLVLPGDTLYVLGYAMPLNDEQAAGQGAPTVMMTKEPNQYFCVSDKREAGVVQSLNSELFVCQFVAPVVSIFCLFVLLMARG